MASKKSISAARLKTMYSRQDSPNWDSSYIPSILANPQEAPKISHAITLTPAKLKGRETHLLSIPERNAALLGLYHPQVIGLQEQRMLWPEAGNHPLWTFPGINKTDLPQIKGVIDVAERLGYIDLLPRLNVENSYEPSNPIPVVFPWVGDLLWLVQPSPEKIYCVNWSVKDTYLDFKRPAPPRLGKISTQNESRAVIGRHEIENTYYKDAKIRTIQVADKAIDHHVSANLRQLFLHHRQELLLTAEQREEILYKYRAALDTSVPPSEVILIFLERGKYTKDQCRSLFFQAIWNRELRVDLFQPILINRPQWPEVRDVAEVYADWFKE